MKKLLTILSLLTFSVSISLNAQSPGSGKALDFGTLAYVEVTNSASLNMTTGITVEAWINSSFWDANSWGGSIVSKEMWSSSYQYGYVLRCGGNGQLSFNIGTTSNWKEVVTATSVMSLNTWNHVVGTYDGSALKIYVNGELVGTTLYSGSINTDNSNLRIGAAVNSGGGFRHFNGKIDEVKLWNVALSQSTIRTWMCKKITSSHPNYANLKAYWKFDEGTGTTTADHSVNTNTATLASTPIWITSAAPIGDSSAFTYTSPFNVSLTGINQDTLFVSNASASPSSVHIYRVDEAPNSINIPTANTGIDTTHYWGIAVFGSPNSTYNAVLNYGNANTGGCNSLDLLGRNDNASTAWTNLNASQNTINNTFTKSISGNKELIIGYTAFSVGNIVTVDPTTFCDGDSAVLSGPQPSIFNFQWLLNNSPIPGANDPLYVAKTSGVYSVICSLGTCFDTTQTISITVHPKPQTPLNSLIYGDSLWSSATYGNQWYDSAGAILGAINQTYKPIHYGIHYVIQTDSNGCISDTSNIIDFGVGISENGVENERMKIYPNPNKGDFSIIIEQNEDVEIRIYNINGQEISTYKLNKNQFNKTIKLKLSSGIYFIKANFNNKVIVQKVVVY
ncbi:MAG: T9SS type A sorting domain-containing protein [Saprospiraceae bacterium]|nr:T9SS type A sorting domain-containing protein [Saprospiraceae bacterium]